MKRLHVHLNVKDISESVDFYRTLFSQDPSVVKSDYAKWDLSDPAVNFSISTQGEPGLQHLGIEAREETELQDLYQRIDAMDAPKLAEGETTCCYARSEKSWVTDPQQISWELFRTLGSAQTFHSPATVATATGCCDAGCCSG